MAAETTKEPLFGTVLVARSPQELPSPLELQMRSSSAKLRIVQKLSGGAHLLLPGSETTIAIRAYFTKDLENRKDDDSDLVAFRNAFRYPICFFILPPGKAQQSQLGDPHSFVTQAQLIMNNRDGTTGQQPDGSARVFIVPHVASAIDILSSVVQTLTHARRDLKKQFHDSVKSNNFVGPNASQKAAAAHVTAAFRNFATRFELPVGEDDVLMSRFGSIAGIGTADLSSAPIYDSTKETLTAFFGSNHHYPGRQPQRQHTAANGMNHHQGMHPNNHRDMDTMGMGAQGPYAAVHNAETDPFQQQHLSNEFQTPLRDSVEQQDMGGFGQFDAWQDPSQPVRATPSLVSQQFVPRHQPPNDADSRRLLPQFNRPPMGNSIRPFSAYSASSGNGGGGVDTTSGYF